MHPEKQGNKEKGKGLLNRVRLSMQDHLHRMERRILVFVQKFLAGSGKCLGRVVLAWGRRHSNSHA